MGVIFFVTNIRETKASSGGVCHSQTDAINRNAVASLGMQRLGSSIRVGYLPFTVISYKLKQGSSTFSSHIDR